jgi:hypothetical protein
MPAVKALFSGVTIEFLLALFTFFVALFTFCLWRATVGLWQVSQNQSIDMKQSLSIAQEAADAADESAKALQASERAYIFSNITIEQQTETESMDILFEAVFYLRNHGRTPAIIEKIAFKGGVSNISPKKENLSEPHDPLESFIGSGECHREDRWQFRITEDQWRNLITTDPNIIVYCLGYVTYTTIFGRKHRHNFCWEFYAPERKFVLFPSKELNYNT